MPTKKPLGKPSKSARGFSGITFQDHYQEPCSLECSSVILDYPDSYTNPGSSCVWLGLSQVNPVVMAKDAKALGIPTKTDVGWIPYPMPEEVLLSSRMHLNREQVAGLIVRLQEWLDTGTIT